MAHEIVKYDNAMNQVTLVSMTTRTRRLMMALCAKLKDRTSETITFDYRELAELIGLEKEHATPAYMFELLNKMSYEMLNIKCSISSNRKMCRFVLFPTFENDQDAQNITVEVNKKFEYLLNVITGRGFTVFELADYCKLDGKYAPLIYQRLKQYRSTGLYIASVEELREWLELPKSYTNKKITVKVIEPAIAQISELGYFKNLTVTAKKARKKGAPIVGYEFTFDVETKAQKPAQEAQAPEAEQIQPAKQPRKRSTNAFLNIPKAQTDYDAIAEKRARERFSVPSN